jgi:hypothetical protein
MESHHQHRQHNWKHRLLAAAVTAAVLYRQRVLWQRDLRVLGDTRRRLMQARTVPLNVGDAPMVSVLVAAWNEAPRLPALIASFRALRCPARELIVSAGGSDGSYAVAAALAGDGVQVIEQHAGQGKQRALRDCYALASGDLIFLTDADCLLDDESFEGTLTPLITQGAAVATGGSRPLDAQLDSAFVRHQWYCDLYVRAHWTAYTGGLLGRNAALTRDAVENAGAFAADVATGTDYHMARALIQHGTRIRHADASQIPTAYADTWDAYRRQQARWLRNVVIHGLRSGAYRDVVSGLLPSLIGTAALALTPYGLLKNATTRTLTGAAWLYVTLNRARYTHFGERLTGQRTAAGMYLRLPLFVAQDFAAWSRALLDYPLKRMRIRW